MFHGEMAETDVSEEYEAQKKSTFEVLKRLYKYIGLGNKRLVYPLIVFITLNILLSWVTPLIFKSLVDDGLGGGTSMAKGDINIIVFLGTLFFIMTIAAVFTRVAEGYIIQKLATITMYNLRDELFVKFQKLGLDYHESSKRTAGKKINYLTGDVNTIQELIQSGLLVAISNFFVIFGTLLIMIWLSPTLTLVTFFIVPILLLILGPLFKISRKYFNELRERVATVTSKLDESIMGMRIIQSFAVEKENQKEFEEATELERQTTMKAAKIMTALPSSMTLLITIGLGMLFYTSGILIREGTTTIGTLVAFMFYLFTFFQPLISFISFITLLQNSIAAGARIVRLLDEEPTVKEKVGAIKLDTVKGRIEYNNVNFSYEENVPVLNDINLIVKENERLALVGYTGSGKSTFIKLLCRFYDPTEGEIKIDGNNLKDIQLKSLRRKMGVVLQENYLFSGTIMENIRYGKLSASDEEVIEAAKKVSAHNFIIELENGYETFVGERGSRLSEGQRQLIAFARALIGDPPILILDEATASIDPYSELLIKQALEHLLKNRTSITIAHRLSTVLTSDRIIVLDRGRIIEQGSHQELVKKENGLYKHLYQMQFKDPFKKDEIKEEEKIEVIDTSRGMLEEKDRFSRFF